MKKFFNIIKTNLILIILLPSLIPFFMYVRNHVDTPIGVFFRAVLISILLFISLIAFAFLILREKKKVILFSSIVFMCLSLYGIFYDLLVTKNSFLGHHKVLAILIGLFFIILALMIRKLKINRNIVLSVKVITVIFLSIQLIQFVPSIIGNSKVDTTNTNYDKLKLNQAELASSTIYTSKTNNRPDVYYIILDLYARNDVIQKDFSFDNSDFTDSLTEIGFYVPNCSRSNYMITENSLASSLNFSYLQDMVDKSDPNINIQQQLIWMIKHPVVFELFRQLGYEINTFQTGYHFTEITNSDNYLQPSKPIAFLGSITPFEILLLKDSILKIFYDTNIPYIKTVFDKITFPYSDHVNLQYFIFENLPLIATNPAPTVTFAHITIPHTPFIFRADGSFTTDHKYYAGLYDAPVSNELFIEGYINQVLFVNEKILNTVEAIIRNSDTPPIIIIQGDHAVDLENRLPILSAYYFPNTSNPGFYPSISPVNSFRLLFNNYFATDFPILDDVSYSGSYDNPQDWRIKPELMDQCIK